MNCAVITTYKPFVFADLVRVRRLHSDLEKAVLLGLRISFFWKVFFQTFVRILQVVLATKERTRMIDSSDEDMGPRTSEEEDPIISRDEHSDELGTRISEFLKHASSSRCL